MVVTSQHDQASGDEWCDSYEKHLKGSLASAEKELPVLASRWISLLDVGAVPGLTSRGADVIARHRLKMWVMIPPVTFSNF